MKEYSVPYLRQKRKRLLQQLRLLEPCMLRGSLIERYKKCGKPYCRCVSGDKHGPSYYLSVSIPGTHPMMIYIPIDIKSKVEKAIETFQKARAITEEISTINRELFLRKKIF